MSTCALVGAGPGVGLSLAKRFGSESFNVGLLARNPENLSALVSELDGLGITAKAYPADVTDRGGIVAALRRLEADLGPVDVLEFSPIPGRNLTEQMLATAGAQGS